MTSIKVRRLASNPHKRKRNVARPVRRVKARKSNPKRHTHRKLSAKQIKFFGSPAQKAALKRKRKRNTVAPAKKRVAKANPRRRRVVAKAAPRKRRRRVLKANPAPRKCRRRVVAKTVARRRKRSNPALVLTLGSVNPRRKTMKRRKRHSTGVARRRRASNPTRVVVRARSKNGRRRTRHVRRNPNVFGHAMSPTQTGMAILGGLAGVTAAKVIPGMLPASLNSAPIRIGAALAVAIASQGIGNKFKPGFGDAMMFGGLMQAGSLLLSAYLPSVGSQIGLNGMGDLVPARFSVPQNNFYPQRWQTPPVMIQAPAAAAGVAGFGRAFGSR